MRANEIGTEPALRTALRLRLLGGFGAYVNETRVIESAFARKRARALLKLLAIKPDHRLHRDQAIEALWPELDVAAASAQLYKAVHHIRQAFAGVDPGAEGLLEFREGILALGGEVITDVADFERLADEALREPAPDSLHRAIAAYTGELLPADRYEEWTLLARDALAERFLDLLAKLGSALLQDGDLAEAADAFRQVLALDPLREEAHRGLMQVFAFEGNRDRAARQYRICKEVLERELGVDPSGETAALHEEIETGALASVAGREEVSAPPSLLAPLVGREEELGKVLRLLDGLRDQDGASFTIEGPAGIGKTRLAHEVLQQARARGYRVAYGTAGAREGRLPYAPLIDALRMLLRADPTAAEHVPGELGAAMPGVAVGPPVGSADRLASRIALFAGVFGFLTVRARRAPLVLVLDDLHRADEGTMLALAYFASRVGSIPLLMAGCWRTDEPEAAAPVATFAETAGERITLGPLSPVEHQALVSQSLGDVVEARASEELFLLGRGNPLFTSELVRQLSGADRLVRRRGAWEFAARGTPADPVPVPSSLHAVLVQRLESLSGGGRDVLDLAAVIGEAVQLNVLHASARAEELGVEGIDPLLDLIGEALDARLVEETGLGYRFQHPLLREGVLRRIAPTRRRVLHRRVARTLEASTPERDRPVETLAYHYREAGDIDTAVAYLMAAAERAESVYDHEDAVLRLKEAIALLAGDETPAAARRRSEAHERLGDVHRTVGRIEAALAAYTTALAALGSSGNGLLAGLHRKIALGAIMAADIPTATDHLALAREAAPPEPIEEARGLIVEALVDWHMNQLEEAVGLGERALEIAERESAQVEIAQACEMLALAHLPLGNWEEGLRYELRREADWSPDLVLATDAHMCLWEYRIRGEDPHRRAKSFIDTVAEQAATMGNLRCLAVCNYALGSIGLARGDFDVARKHLSASLEIHEQLGSAAGVAFTLARLLGLETDMGSSAGMDLFDRALEAAEGAAVRDHALMMVHGAGMKNRLAAGDLRGAAVIMASAEKLEADSPPCPICSLEMLPVMSAVFLENGEIDEARTRARRAAELAEMGHNQVGAARATVVEGQIHVARGETKEAERCFSDAVDAFRILGHRLELAMTLQAWGALPRGAAAKAEAEELLSSLHP